MWRPKRPSQMGINLRERLSKLSLSPGRKKKQPDGRKKIKGDAGLPSRIQTLVSQGEYYGLSQLVRAEGAFVQYHADGTFYRRVGLGITHDELLLVSEPLPDNEDDVTEGLKINIVFPLPAVLFILLDNRSKRFAVCTCVGLLMFFEMCIDEPKCDENWQRWRRVIFLQADEKLHAEYHQMQAPSWNPDWTSPYVINLAGQNDQKTYEFLAERKGHLDRTLHFIQQPFTVRLVRHIGVQTGRASSPGQASAYWGQLRRDTVKSGGLSRLQKESIVPGGHRTPSQSLKSSAKSYLEKIEHNRAGHNKLEISDSTEREIHANKIVLSASGAMETFTSKTGQNTKDADMLLLQSMRPMKPRAIRQKREDSFYGGVKCLLDAPLVSRERTRSRPIRKSCSCDDLLLTDECARLTKAEKIVACSWGAGAYSSGLTASDKVLSKKYRRCTQRMRRQSSRRPLEMSSPRDDVEDIDALVSDFVEKKGHSKRQRSGRELWDLAKRKIFSRRQRSHLHRFQNVVHTFLKMSMKRESSNKLTDLTPLAVALELFSVSKKMLLTVSASDVINFSNNKKLLEVKPLYKIIKFGDDVTRMVASQILQCRVLWDRIDRIRFFIEVCKHLLLRCHDIQTFISVMRALISPPVFRLQNTWRTFCMEYPLHFSTFICFCKVLSQADGFRAYKSRLEIYMARGEPCIPWLEHLLVHCSHRPGSDGKSDSRIRYSSKVQKITKGKQKNQKKFSDNKRNSVVKVADKHLKPILKPHKIFQDVRKKKKSVHFSSKVDTAERLPGTFDIMRGNKVALGEKIVEPSYGFEYSDEEMESIENYGDETATHIIDGAIQDVRRQTKDGRIPTRAKKKHQKTSGVYLKRNANIDEAQSEADREDDVSDAYKRFLAQLHDSITDIKPTHESETNILPSAIKQNQKKLFHSKPKVADNQEPDDMIQNIAKVKPFKGKETDNRKAKEPLKEMGNKISLSASSSQEKIEHSRKTKSKRSDSSSEKSKGNIDMRERLGVYPRSEPLNVKKESPRDVMPPRKRKMSYIEMKKQNRRMSLFEQAEQKIDHRKRDNVIEDEIQKKIRGMRRKGSIAMDLLQPDDMKSLSRNNNFNDSEVHKTYSLVHKADSVIHKADSGVHQTDGDTMKIHKCKMHEIQDAEIGYVKNHHSTRKSSANNAMPWAFGDYIDIGILTIEDEQVNNSNSNKLPFQNAKSRRHISKPNTGVNKPCRSMSDTCLRSRRTISEKKCGLCGYRECVYKDGPWKSLLQMQLNVLESETHSSSIAKKCIKAAMVVSSRISDRDLLLMSLTLEG